MFEVSWSRVFRPEIQYNGFNALMNTYYTICYHSAEAAANTDGRIITTNPSGRRRQ